MGVVEFSADASVLSQLSYSKRVLEGAILGYSASGGTHISAGLTTAQTVLQGVNSRVDSALVGRSDARLLSPPQFCYQLSVNVAGGCSAWYAYNTGNGRLQLCRPPTGSNNKCESTLHESTSSAAADPSTDGR